MIDRLRRHIWLLLAGSVVAIITSASIAAGLAYSARQPQLASLHDNVSDLGKSLDAYHQIAGYQEEIAHSLRLKLKDSIGDRLVITEAIQEELPKTITEAEALGYSLLDKVTSEGKLIEAACFNHEDARHYGKRDPKITDKVEWHGAPFLLIYNSNSKKLMGMVLESTSPQPAPPWEFHAHGHPSMDFSHWSLHLWFTEPPKNLSIG